MLHLDELYESLHSLKSQFADVSRHIGYLNEYWDLNMRREPVAHSVLDSIKQKLEDLEQDRQEVQTALAVVALCIKIGT